MALLYYPMFDFITIDSDGYRQAAASEDIDFYNLTQDVLIDTLTTDADGVIGKGSFSDGSFPVAVNDVVELRHATLPGMARFTLKASEADAVLAVENNIASVVLDDDSTDQESDAVKVLVQNLSDLSIAPIEIGTAKPSGVTTLPFTAQDGDQFRVYAAKVHKDFDFHAANLEQVSSIDILVGTSADGPPTFTSVSYDSANSEVDLVFEKVGTATGDIKVEYKVTGTGTWTEHPTDFAHGATSGSLVITEGPSAVTYDIRLKQDGVSGYSVTRQVIVDASGSGTPPTNLSAVFNEDPCVNPEVDLSWTAGSGAGNYTVERKQTFGGSWSTLDSSVAGTTYTDIMVGPIVTGTAGSFSYRVKQNDVSGYSNEDAVYITRC
jgi:hypothetical protein